MIDNWEGVLLCVLCDVTYTMGRLCTVCRTKAYGGRVGRREKWGARERGVTFYLMR